MTCWHHDNQVEHLSLRTSIRYIRLGLKFGYPLCCILRFSLRVRPFPGAKRGGCDNGPDRFDSEWTDGRSVFVPCNIFHQHDTHLPPAPCTCVMELAVEQA